MRTFIVSVKRRPGLPVEDFRARWAAAAGARQVSALPGLRRYVRSLPDGSAYSRGREPAFDAVAELWFDTDQPVDLAAAPGYAALQWADADLVDPARWVALPVEEVPIVDGPPAPVKLVMFVRRRPDLTVAQFREHWRDVHGPIGARNPYLRRYVQWHVREPSPTSSPFDGVGMVWFDSMADVRASGTTPDAAESAADGPRFAEGGAPAVTLVVSETVVLP